MDGGGAKRSVLGTYRTQCLVLYVGLVLGNTILVKLELWESVILNNNFCTNLCLCYASAKYGR
jgi:hypothetical protein